MFCVGVPLLLVWVMARRRYNHNPDEGPRTSTGVVMGHVYDPTRFRTLDYVISDEGQSRPEVIVVNNANHASNLLLIEGKNGLTVLEIGSEDHAHDRTAPL